MKQELAKTNHDFIFEMIQLILIECKLSSEDLKTFTLDFRDSKSFSKLKILLGIL